MKTRILKILSCLLLLTSITNCATAVDKNTISGVIRFDHEISNEKIKRVVIKLMDVSRADAIAKIIEQITISKIEATPIPYEIHYSKTDVNQKHSYTIFVEIYQIMNNQEHRTNITTQSYPVKTQYRNNIVDVLVSKIR